MKSALSTLAMGAMASHAAFAATVSAPSTEWTRVVGNYDYLHDQQTGIAAGDIVGTETDFGFFVTHNDNGNASLTDGTIGFRLRLDDADGNNNTKEFDRAAWLGIDADLNGSVDVYLGVNMAGNESELGIFSPGAEANISPSTSSIVSPAYRSYSTSNPLNFNYRPVDHLTDGGTTDDVTTTTTGDPDYYVSFMVPFADVVGFLSLHSIDITDQSPLRYVVATSTQGNSLNQDLGGVDGGVDSGTSWVDLGGFSPIVNAGGTVIPEPASPIVAAASVMLSMLRRRRA